MSRRVVAAEQPIVSGFTPHALASAVDGVLAEDGGATHVGPICTDSRTIRPGDTFWALRGPRFDGHEFVEEAVDKGAVGVVVERDFSGPLPGHAFVVEVEDTTHALGTFAAAVIGRRRAMGGDFVAFALTGSNGKTTTKEMLAALLRTRFGNAVLATRGNLNNWIGLPLTVFGLGYDHAVCVLEMGANAPGEIARMVEIVHPDVCILTNVAEAHLEGFGSVEGVARAKGELFEHAGDAERFVLTRDTLERFYPELGDDERTVVVGVESDCDLVIDDIETVEGGLRARYTVPSRRGSDGADSFEIQIPLAGAHNASNLGLALAATHDFELETSAIRSAIEALDVPGGRMQSIYADGVVVLQDAYNANPASMRAAMSVLESMASEPARRLLVLGEMKELGDASETLHREVGAHAAELAPRLLYVVADDPELGRAVIDGARAAGLSSDTDVRVSGASDADIAAIAAALKDVLGEGDVILLKGSRGVALERLVPHIHAAVDARRTGDRSPAEPERNSESD